MIRYSGYLAPYKPIIAAMSLAGMKQTNMSGLLYALGARPPGWSGYAQYYPYLSQQAWETQAINRSLSALISKWKMEGAPV